MRHLAPALFLAATLLPATALGQQAGTVPRRPPAGSRLTIEQLRDWSDFSSMGRGAIARRDLKYAEDLFKRAIDIARIEADTDPRLLARSYGDLAWVLHGEGRDAEAEPLAEWALIVREKYFGHESMQAGQTAYTLAMIEIDRGRPDEAVPHLEQSLAACEAGMGPNHPSTADALDDLATLLVLRRSYDRARPLYERSLAILRKNNPDHPGRYVPLDGLATIDMAQGRYDEAGARLDEAIQALGRDRYADPSYHAAILGRKAETLRKTNRADEAARVEARAKEVAARPAAAPPQPPQNPRGSHDVPANGWPGAPPGQWPAPGAGGRRS
jgi:tetratricopeptide (TPR) repeat protein